VPAALHLDFLDRRYWWDGVERAFSDLVIAAGSPALAARGLSITTGDRVHLPAPALFRFDGGTLLVEWDRDGVFADYGCVFSAIGSGSPGDSFSASVLSHDTSVNSRAARLFSRSATQVHAANPIGNAGLQTGVGRALYSWAVGRQPRAAALGGASLTFGTSQTAAAGAPTTLALGYRLFAADEYLRGYVRRVTYWAADASAAWIQAQAAIAPLTCHILGDSFVMAVPIQTLAQSTWVAQFRVVTADGVGGSTLTQQATRYLASSSTVKAKTLVILDGGLDTDTATSIAAIDAITAAAGHGRWLYVEPSPAEQAAGTPGRIAWDATVAAIRAHVGEDHYVETLSRALSLGDGGPDDLADIANNIWPRSLRSDSIHPTNTGWMSVIGTQLAAKFAAMGW
jgi:hypothetical protein